MPVTSPQLSSGGTTARPLLRVLPQSIHQPQHQHCRAQLGQQGQPLPLWAAPGDGGGGQNPHRNSQSLGQDQHRPLVSWFSYTTGRLAWFVKWEMHHHMAAWGREGDCVCISMELNTKPHLHCLQALLSPKPLQNPEWGPVPQFQVYFRGKGVMFFRGFTFQYFTLAIRLLGSPHKAVPLVLEIWTARFGELSWNTPPRQLSSCLWDEEKDNCQDCFVQTALYPCSFSVFFVFCVLKHEPRVCLKTQQVKTPPPPEFLFKL